MKRPYPKNRIALLRCGFGDSVEAISYICDVPVQLFMSFERGLVEPPYDTIRFLSGYFGVTPDFLMGY